MIINIQYYMNDCRDCPFKHYHYGHGECWYECSHKDNGRGAYEDILWGCGEQFSSVPVWCPLPFPNKK